MSRFNFAVFSEDKRYISSFLEYADRAGKLPFMIHGFTDREVLEAAVQRGRISAVLLFEDEDSFEEMKKEYLLVCEFRTIDRIKSASKIIEEMKSIYNELTMRDILPEQDGVKVIGVYNFYGENGVWLNRAAKMFEYRQTLFIDLVRFGDFWRDFDDEVEGMIYDFKVGRELRTVETWNDPKFMVDILAGPLDPRDLEELSEDEWPLFFNKLKEMGYGAIILNGIEVFSRFEMPFTFCDEVYLNCPNQEDLRCIIRSALNMIGRAELAIKIKEIDENEFAGGSEETPCK